MATTRPFQIPSIGEGGVDQKTMAAAGEGRNRRALGDIGNLVTIPGGVTVVDGKPLPRPVSRSASKPLPVSRSFYAKLLAQAQAIAKTKKPLAVNGEGKIVVDGAAKARAPKLVVPNKKVVTATAAAKRTPPSISPDSNEVAKEKPIIEGDGMSSEDVSLRKKKPQSLTSTLTARSKSASGVASRPQEQIVDIDALDTDNELAVVEYVEDIYKFYKLIENESRVHDYMHSQPEINEKMRAILIDWLIAVHNKFELLKETLYLTINIVDRFLAAGEIVLRKELQLVGIAALLMASKYEEIWAPEVNDLVCISDGAYTYDQVLKMEKRILGKLEWSLTVPTLYVFLVRFIKASVPDTNVDNMVYFLAEMGIMNYATIRYCPSMIAASAVYAARATLNMSPLWNDTLKLHTGFSESQLIECATLLVGFHSTASGDKKLQVIYRKYSNSQRGDVALIPPAKALLAAASSS